MVPTNQDPTLLFENLKKLAFNPTPLKPSYKSVFHDKIRADIKAQKKSKSTLGPLKTQPKDPKKYLRKGNNKEGFIPNYEKDFPKSLPKRINERIRAPVPKTETVCKEQANKMNLTRAKTFNSDFISKNAVIQMTTPAKKPEKNLFCDTNFGRKNDLTPSGLTPIYSKKSKFGKVPKYLQNMKANESYSKQNYEKYLQSINPDPKISAEKLRAENSEKAIHLKSELRKVKDAYNCISIVTDTFSKRKYKQSLEMKMVMLENDIMELDGSTQFTHQDSSIFNDDSKPYKVVKRHVRAPIPY